MMKLARILPAWAATLAMLSGCVAPIQHEMTTDFPAAVVYALGTAPVTDGRSRFREIFCRLLAADPDYQRPDGGCDNFLLRLNDEPLPPESPRPLPGLQNRYRVMIVPGLPGACFARVGLAFSDALKTFKGRGVQIEPLAVSSPADSDANAGHIAGTIERLSLGEDEKLVLIGHSKGAVDILHFLVNHRQISRRVDAVISVAGAINGTPLFSELDTIYADAARYFQLDPLESCDIGNFGQIDALQPARRLSWLAANPLPPTVRYFSLAAFAGRARISKPLQNGYDRLWILSPRNDGILLAVDQLIPGGTLLGYANADHLSVVLGHENKHAMTSETARPTTKFPNHILLQAAFLYVVEALEQDQEPD
jgi:hypothetical protein